MAKNIYFKEALTGGAANAVDGIDTTGFTSGNICNVYDGTSYYVFRHDASSSASENSPYIIAPDSGTGRWILQGYPWKSDSGEVFFHSNMVRDPQRMAWNVGSEAYINTGYVNTQRVVGYPLTGTSAFTAIGYAGAVGQVTVDDTYATILNVTSGAGIVTNFILPGVTATSDIVTLKVTLDGVEYELAFTAANATDRFVSGLIETLSVYANYSSWAAWPAAANANNLAARLPDGNSNNLHLMVAPSRQIGITPCLRFLTSLKVEMKSSDVSTTNYRDYGGVAYVLDQY